MTICHKLKLNCGKLKKKNTQTLTGIPKIISSRNSHFGYFVDLDFLL